MVRAKYILELTATPTRKDGHQPIIFMQCGPIVHQIDPKNQMKTMQLQHKIVVQKTTFAGS